MLNTGDPNLLPIDHILITLFDGSCFEFGGIGTGSGLGNRHGLQAQFTSSDLGKVEFLLNIGAMAQ